MFNARTGRPRLARRVAARGPDACGGTKMSEKNGKAAEARPKRKYVTRERLLAALEKEREMSGRKSGRDTCGFRPDDRRIRHPKLGLTVTVEMRTGSGTTSRTILRSKAFKSVHGVVRQTASRCNPAIHHCTDRFYGQIDSDLAKWRYEEDLKLKVPYAVKENRRRRLEHARLRKYAIERGLI